MITQNQPAKFRLLDLFCCAGGAAMGYHRAGFEVIGIDIEPQPRYPFEFHQANAMVFLRGLALSDILGEPTRLDGAYWSLSDFDAVHASPPCQGYSTITPDQSKHPRLIADVREILQSCDLPYVIENVAGARRHMRSPVMLCGSMFGLSVRRHRYFESSVALITPECRHDIQPYPVGVYGDHADAVEVMRPDGTRRGRKASSLQEAREAMGIPWATWHELAEAIPPAYTEFIGHQLMRSIDYVEEAS